MWNHTISQFLPLDTQHHENVVVRRLLQGIYPSIPHSELSLKFGIANSETERQIVMPSHTVLDTMHKIDRSDLFKESVIEIIG